MSTNNIIIPIVNIILPFVTLSFLMSSFRPPVQPSSRHSNHSSPTTNVCLLCPTHNPILNSDSYQFVNKYRRIISLSTSGVRTCKFVMAYTKCYLSFQQKENYHLYLCSKKRWGIPVQRWPLIADRQCKCLLLQKLRYSQETSHLWLYNIS